jgi:hypothetical protein
LFFETYQRQPILATLLRELSWTHNLIIIELTYAYTDFSPKTFA